MRKLFIQPGLSLYKEYLTERLELQSQLNDEIKKAPYAEIVEDYDKSMEKISKKEIEIQQIMQAFNKNIKTLEECKELSKKFVEVYSESKIILNNRKIGTLEEKAAYATKKHNMPLDEHGQTVIDLLTNRVGGKNISKKSKTKRNKYTVKNFYNKTKNRRLKRNV